MDSDTAQFNELGKSLLQKPELLATSWFFFFFFLLLQKPRKVLIKVDDFDTQNTSFLMIKKKKKLDPYINIGGIRTLVSSDKV